MPNLENLNSGQSLSESKVDLGGTIHKPLAEGENKLSQHYVNKGGELLEIIDKAGLDKYIKVLDSYLNKLTYAVGSGQNSEDLGLLSGNELFKNIDLLNNLLRQMVTEGYDLISISSAKIPAGVRTRAHELLNYLDIIKQKREILINDLKLIDKFSEEEVWLKVHIHKDRLAEIILHDLSRYDNNLWHLEFKLFDLNKKDKN